MQAGVAVWTSYSLAMMQGQDDFEAMMNEPAAFPLPQFPGPANVGSIEPHPWQAPGRNGQLLQELLSKSVLRLQAVQIISSQ